MDKPSGSEANVERPFCFCHHALPQPRIGRGVQRRRHGCPAQMGLNLSGTLLSCAVMHKGILFYGKHCCALRIIHIHDG